MNKFRYLTYFLTILCPFFCFSEIELLQAKDISIIMQQIFDQHVNKKEMTASIVKKSFKIYIDQFDPERIYLTYSDVKPFLEITEAEVNAIMEEYRKNVFSKYVKLNEVIQKSIKRARGIRNELEKSHDIFNGASKINPGDPKREFPKSEANLKNQIQSNLLKFIANEQMRYGYDQVDRAVKNYEIQARNHENPYLFLNERGQPMGEAEKQNTFAMHILKSLASSLDAHTSVLDLSEAYDMKLRLEKEIEGIGISFRQDKFKNIIVGEVLKGSEAFKSGRVKPGDELLEINGKSVKKVPLEEVMGMIRGKNGTKVKLKFKRQENGNEEEVIDVELMRHAIYLDEDRAQFTSEKFGNGIIGIISLNSFYQGDNGVTSEIDVKNAIKELDRQGNLRGLILDIRENSGGFLSQAVKVAGLFITNGIVVISKYFNGEEHFYRDMDGKVAFNGPLILLTSKATASAAEIVAQALQDYGMAIIVGDEHTYGKGTIQSQTVTQNQSLAYFKVTVGKYYTVSGKTPQIQGVKADIVVPSQFLHENIGEEFLEYTLQKDTIPETYEDTLSDISPNLRPWYLRYYTPTLQHKKNLWLKALPFLKKNSQIRIANNSDYQNFLKNPYGYFAKKNRNEDMQMAEAMNIMKDMVMIESKVRQGDEKNENHVFERAGAIE